VVIAAYTMDRWELLTECVESVLTQDPRPQEVLLCIDNNEELYQRASAAWSDAPTMTVMRNPDVDHVLFATAHERAHGTKRRFGAGSARNAAVAATDSDIVAIIDDDARADPGWLSALLRCYESDSVVAVGGPPLPRYETGRPDWFPRSFDWVFGCAYEGLPTTRQPYRHLIGANMSFRRTAFDAVGGFGSIDFDDLDLCMKLGHRYGFGSLIYEPAAVVRHFVPAERVTWQYFWRRCVFVNTEKVEAFHGMGEAANLNAEVGFAVKAATLGVLRELSRVLRGDFAGVQAAAAIYVGLACAAFGNLRGRLHLALGKGRVAR
jgi:cellulose synthase/poly-beta-1,6-N-acetylglucosamine synthase-like glycosyltransferase